MKKLLLFALALFCLTVNIYAQSGGNKILIAYFSYPETDGVDAVSGASRVIVDGKVNGNVEFAANVIQKATGGDIFIIRTVRSYPAGHRPLLEAAQEEQKTNARPPLATHIANLQNYDTIILCYPIWWYDLPMSIYSFLDEYDFSGKTIIPFTVHGGSRFSGTIERIIKAEPGAKVIQDSLAVSRNGVANSTRDIQTWLRKLGITK